MTWIFQHHRDPIRWSSEDSRGILKFSVSIQDYRKNVNCYSNDSREVPAQVIPTSHLQTGSEYLNRLTSPESWDRFRSLGWNEFRSVSWPVEGTRISLSGSRTIPFVTVFLILFQIFSDEWAISDLLPTYRCPPIGRLSGITKEWDRLDLESFGYHENLGVSTPSDWYKLLPQYRN